jgi:hypothetical protein
VPPPLQAPPPPLSLDQFVTTTAPSTHTWFAYDSASSSDDDNDDDISSSVDDLLTDSSDLEKELREKDGDAFAKNVAVLEALRQRLLSLCVDHEFEQSPKRIVVLSNMGATADWLDNMTTRMAHTDPVLRRRLHIECECLRVSLRDQVEVESDLVIEAFRHELLPVIIYFYHMDLNFEVEHGACFSRVRYMDNVDSIFFVETPMVRLVDDRASHLLAADLEQRLLARFCNEFSNTRGRVEVYRFVLDYCDNGKDKTVDREWYEDTRWYACGKK